MSHINTIKGKLIASDNMKTKWLLYSYYDWTHAQAYFVKSTIFSEEKYNLYKKKQINCILITILIKRPQRWWEKRARQKE